MSTIKQIKIHDEYPTPLPLALPGHKEDNNMSEENLPIASDILFNKIISTAEDVLMIKEFPDDKVVKISAKFTVCLESVDITIFKK